jgi:hypothetical protein
MVVSGSLNDVPTTNCPASSRVTPVTYRPDSISWATATVGGNRIAAQARGTSGRKGDRQVLPGQVHEREQGAEQDRLGDGLDPPGLRGHPTPRSSPTRASSTS